MEGSMRFDEVRRGRGASEVEGWHASHQIPSVAAIEVALRVGRVWAAEAMVSRDVTSRLRPPRV